MRFEFQGMLAVATKDRGAYHQPDNGIVTYSVALFEDQIERDSYYITLLDVDSADQARELLIREMTRMREARKNRGSVVDRLT